MRVQTKFIQPSIDILNLRIDEPITAITDVLLAVICLYAFVGIGKHHPAGRMRNYLRFYFLILGMGALTGGLLGHAFLYRLAEGWKLVSLSTRRNRLATLIESLVNAL